MTDTTQMPRGGHSIRRFAAHYAEMVAWMRIRGHGWQPSMEMAASMLLPTVAVLGLLWTGVAGGIGTLMVLEHVAMLACMLAAMLIRRDEYAGAAHAHGSAQPALAA